MIIEFPYKAPIRLILRFSQFSQKFKISNFALFVFFSI